MSAHSVISKPAATKWNQKEYRSQNPAGQHELLWMVVAAMAVRLVVMAFLYHQQLDPWRDHFRFGYEAGRLARSLTEGRGFSSPLFADTGPSAWMTPLYPAIVAGFFKVFGVYTQASAIAILSFNALTSALTCVPIYLFATRDFGYDVGKYAGWAWAFFPYAIYFPEERIWETWLSTLLLCLLFLIVHHLRRVTNLGTLIGTGVLWGIAGLNSAMVLTLVPVLQSWFSYRLHKLKRNWIRPNLVCAVVFAGVVSPWMIRNYRTFHRFIPFRDNIGLVMRLGTKGDTDYWGAYELGPWHNPAEWREFQQHGELQYMDIKKQQALKSIGENPGWYVHTAFRRIVFMWTGYWSLEPWYLQQEPLDPLNILFCSTLTILSLFGLWKAFQTDLEIAIVYTLVLAIFPFSYYFTSPEFYYRRVIDPFCVVLAVNALVNSRSRLRRPAALEKYVIDAKENFLSGPHTEGRFPY